MEQERENNRVYARDAQLVQEKDDRYYLEKWNLLSPREREVAALIGLNYRSYEIAKTLGISYDTVRAHAKKIYRKFGVSNKEFHQARNNYREIVSGWDLATWWDKHHP